MSERPLYPGYRRPKKGANWPMWMIWGVFGLGILAFVFHSTGKPDRSERASSEDDASRLPGRVTFGTNYRELRTGGCYQLSAETPLYEKFGWQTTARKPALLATLPADAIIDIRNNRRVGDDPWYHVNAVASDGKTPLGAGWVDSDTLKGQKLRVLH